MAITDMQFRDPAARRRAQPQNFGVPGQTAFTQDQNLIGTQVNPVNSERADGAGGLADQAAGTAAGYEFQPFQGVNPVNTSTATGAFAGANDRVKAATAPGFTGAGPVDTTGVKAGLNQSNLQAQATGNYGIEAGGAGGVNFGQDVARARAAGISGLEQSFSSPDRGKLAADAFALAREQTEPAYMQAQQATARKAGALGRVKAGQTTSELNDIYTAREKSLDQTNRGMALDAAGQTLQDQLARVSAAQGLAGTFGGLDIGAAGAAGAASGDALRRAEFMREGDIYKADSQRRNAMDQYGVDRDTYGDAVSERDTAYGVGRDQLATEFDKADGERRYGQDMLGVEEGRFDRDRGERDAAYNADQDTFQNKRSIAGDTAANEDRILRNEGSARDEVRGERDYQYGAQEDATRNARDQRILEEDLLDRRFNRGIRARESGLRTS